MFLYCTSGIKTEPRTLEGELSLAAQTLDRAIIQLLLVNATLMTSYFLKQQCYFSDFGSLPRGLFEAGCEERLLMAGYFAYFLELLLK